MQSSPIPQNLQSCTQRAVGRRVKEDKETKQEEKGEEFNPTRIQVCPQIGLHM